MTTARPYAGRSRAERDQDRRTRLRGAGLDLFAGQGFAGTSIERLCTAARVSTRHFYELYSGKEDAFLDVYDAITARAFAGASASLTATADQPMRERVPQAFLAYLRPTLSDIRAARIAFVEIMGISPRVEERRLEYREALVRLVQAEGGAAVARGEVTDRDFRFATLALAGAANAIVYDWAAQERRGDVRIVEAELTALALRLLVE